MAAQRGDTADYRRLFLDDAPLMDARAPVEFARGAFPGASNLPLMDDDERAAVGTCYKDEGAAAARALGHELVSGELREARIARWKAFAEAHPDGYLYCFRGGLRSQIVQEWLAAAGIDYPRIRGGYKAMRTFLLDSLQSLAGSADIVLVAGATGTGKTRLIRELPGSIDLEGLAQHRGSAFGRFLQPQPTQIDFENALAIALLKLAEAEGPVFLEDEGKLIGRIALPEPLRQRMAQAPILLLEYPLEQRVQVVLEDYILDLGERYAAVHGSRGPAEHRQRLLDDLARTRKRLGGARYREIDLLMRSAFDQQEAGGGVDAHRQWIERLLSDYYDPMYQYQLSRREGQLLCRGDRDTLGAFVHERLARAD